MEIDGEFETLSLSLRCDKNPLFKGRLKGLADV